MHTTVAKTIFPEKSLPVLPSVHQCMSATVVHVPLPVYKTPEKGFKDWPEAPLPHPLNFWIGQLRPQL